MQYTEQIFGPRTAYRGLNIFQDYDGRYRLEYPDGYPVLPDVSFATLQLAKQMIDILCLIPPPGY
jgi:hypothetical protein